MKLLSGIVRVWATAAMILVLGVILFIFCYIFYEGASVINPSFLLEAPKGAILGSEGGIFPAIIGSLYFTLTAVVLGGLPAVATAAYLVFFCRNRRIGAILHTVINTISGIPSIVLGLFAYSFLVKTLGLGRCILSSGTALAVMILPFIEVRAEKAFRELPGDMVLSSEALGCSRTYMLFKIALPACRGELISAVLLGGCYAMGATPPLIFTGAVAYASVPDSILEPAMALPMHLYLLVAQGATSMDMAYGTAFVMLAVILLCTLAARMLGGIRK